MENNVKMFKKKVRFLNNLKDTKNKKIIVVKIYENNWLNFLMG